VYELRHGAESSSDPRREHARLDVFLAPFSSLPFDDACAAKCAEIRRALERREKRADRMISRSPPWPFDTT